MGITANEFFENIYSVIFSPKAFFEREDIKISTRLSAGTITFISAVNKFASAVSDGSIYNFFFIFSFLWAIIVTICIWFLTALFFEYMAKIFDRGGNLKLLLFYTAFAPVPYIFYAPLNLIKKTGEIGYITAALIEVFLYLWIIGLYALSLRAVYKISISRAFMLIFLPFIASFFAFYQAVGFFTKMWYIFSI